MQSNNDCMGQCAGPTMKGLFVYAHKPGASRAMECLATPSYNVKVGSVVQRFGGLGCAGPPRRFAPTRPPAPRLAQAAGADPPGPGGAGGGRGGGAGAEGDCPPPPNRPRTHPRIAPSDPPAGGGGVSTNSSTKRSFPLIALVRMACCMNSPTMGNALRAPCPHASLRSVMRPSLQPAQAPATTRACIRMTQPSVLSCVVPVLPATSAWMP